ncbi:MAG: ribosomal-processing cysteine protease Prp [Firmicutes bacterium]|jgi:uncharacterized protein YsxB (DUF464 family)|nr:ribosomal-processing cysteine protease Prp [Bacillota bacterium]
MIKVTFRRDSRGHIKEFTVEGHAVFAPAGEDIVCAAVSALAQAAILGIEEVVGVKPSVKKADGYLECRLPGGLATAQLHDVGLLLETMALGLRETAEAYPRHVKISDRK